MATSPLAGNLLVLWLLITLLVLLAVSKEIVVLRWNRSVLLLEDKLLLGLPSLAVLIRGMGLRIATRLGASYRLC